MPRAGERPMIRQQDPICRQPPVRMPEKRTPNSARSATSSNSPACTAACGRKRPNPMPAARNSKTHRGFGPHSPRVSPGENGQMIPRVGRGGRIGPCSAGSSAAIVAGGVAVSIGESLRPIRPAWSRAFTPGRNWRRTYMDGDNQPPPTQPRQWPRFARLPSSCPSCAGWQQSRAARPARQTRPTSR